MYKYIDFKIDQQVLCHKVDVDFNKDRVQQHLRALIRGYGSATEGILIDFVKGTTTRIEDYNSVQDAWNRLDSEQKEYVLAFRNLTSQYILGDAKNLPHLFYIEVILREYGQLVEKYEEDHGEDDLTIEKRYSLACEAEKLVKQKIQSTVATAAFSIVEEAEMV